MVVNALFKKEQCQHSSKHLIIMFHGRIYCKLYRFGTTWGWIKDDNKEFFSLNYPFKQKLCFCHENKWDLLNTCLYLTSSSCTCTSIDFKLWYSSILNSDFQKLSLCVHPLFFAGPKLRVVMNTNDPLRVVMNTNDPDYEHIYSIETYDDDAPVVEISDYDTTVNKSQSMPFSSSENV